MKCVTKSEGQMHGRWEHIRGQLDIFFSCLLCMVVILCCTTRGYYRVHLSNPSMINVNDQKLCLELTLSVPRYYPYRVLKPVLVFSFHWAPTTAPRSELNQMESHTLGTGVTGQMLLLVTPQLTKVRSLSTVVSLSWRQDWKISYLFDYF